MLPMGLMYGHLSRHVPHAYILSKLMLALLAYLCRRAPDC